MTDKKMIPFAERVKTKCGRSCKHWRYDMDSSYCAHPVAMAKSWAGLSENAMSRERVCFHGNDYEQPTDDLYEAHK